VEFAEPLAGAIDLTGARTGFFTYAEANWPNTAHLRGFTYDTFRDDSVPVHERLKWLRTNGMAYAPEIYDQLASVYRQAGREEAARRVMIAKHWARRKAVNPAAKLANWLLWGTVGYGYLTWLAALWILGFLVLGQFVFPGSQMSPVGSVPAAQYHRLAYSLDALMPPFVDLGQEKAFRPRPGTSALYWSWGFITSGWVLTTAVIAGLTATLRRTP
jgi:hypothetical protein